MIGSPKPLVSRSPMSGAELRSIAVSLNGGQDYGSRNNLAALLTVSEATVGRLLSAETVDPQTALLVRFLAAEARLAELAGRIDVLQREYEASERRREEIEAALDQLKSLIVGKRP